MLIDSHCHLNFDAFDNDRADVLARSAGAGVAAFINPATHLGDSRQIITISEKLPNLFAAVGVHPNETAGFDDSVLADLREVAKHHKVVAIGEIGLDYYWDATPRPHQRRVFEQQLALAREINKPVIIHQREAVADTMAILRQWAAGNDHPGLVLHSFSGDMDMAAEAVALGFYVGISGPVTFKNVRDLPDIVRALPAGRLLVETDAPFLSPHPYRGKRNEPARVKLIAEKVAALQELSFTVMSEQLTTNTVELFHLPEINEQTL
jgi:TatD DNase family protein